VRLEHSGNAKVTTLAAGLGDSSADLIVVGADLSNWPDGSVGPFYGSVGKDLPTEEKILFSSRSGNTLQVWTSGPDNGRGQDGTSIQSHSVNEPLEHIWTATEADQANAHIEATSGVHGLPANSDIMTLSGDQEATGAKTFPAPVLNDPVITGGTAAGMGSITADVISLVGAQAAEEWRVRNIYMGTGIPADTFGNDGDLFISRDLA
jgi:hypothetical protein